MNPEYGQTVSNTGPAAVDFVHETAYWRSVAAGLQYENEQLYALLHKLTGHDLRNMKQGTHSHGPGSENFQAVQSTVQVQVQGHTNVVQQHAYRPQQEEESSSDESDTSSEEEESEDNQSCSPQDYSQNEYFQQEGFSQQHGIATNNEESTDLEEYLAFARISEAHKKNRGTGEGNAGEDQFDFEELKAEMRDLYGDKSEEVHEAETVAQMRFDKFCDARSAKPWPIIPFRSAN